jgi:hypothetical protein
VFHLQPSTEPAITVNARATLSLDGRLVVISGSVAVEVTALIVSVKQAASRGMAKGLWKRVDGDLGRAWMAVLPVYGAAGLEPGDALVMVFDPMHPYYTCANPVELFTLAEET